MFYIRCHVIMKDKCFEDVILIPDTADVTDVTAVTDVTDVADIADIADIADVADAADVADVADIADVTDIADIAGIADAILTLLWSDLSGNGPGHDVSASPPCSTVCRLVTHSRRELPLMAT